MADVRVLFVLFLATFIALAPEYLLGANIYGDDPLGEPVSGSVSTNGKVSTPAGAQKASPVSLLKGTTDQPVTIRRANSLDVRAAVLQDGADALNPLGQGEPLGLVAGDFDEDGTRDLVTSYGSATGGALTIQRGNVSALFPNSPRARTEKAEGTFSSLYFFPDAVMSDLPARPDFLGAGDFDGDGHCDIVFAAHGSSTLWWLAGNGDGGFGAPMASRLRGEVTALVVGEMNRTDGLEDVVVAVTGTKGPALLVFEGPSGARLAAPEKIDLPAPAIALTLGQFDADYPRDLAATSGSNIVMVYGRDRKLSMDSTAQAAVGKARIEVHPVGFNSIGIAAGKFHGTSEQTLSLLDDSGAVHFVDPRSLGESPPTLAATSLLTADRELAAPRGRRLLVPTHSSSGRGDGVVVVDSPGSRLVVARESDRDAAAPARTQAIELSSPPAAVLPLRLNVDALDDLVILKADAKSPIIVSETSGGTHFTVTTTQGYINPDYCHGDWTDDPRCLDCNKGPDGTCSYSEAFRLCEIEGRRLGHSVPCTIDFNVPGPGVPWVLGGLGTSCCIDPLTIDGSTQGAGRVRFTSDVDSPVYNNTTVRNLIMQRLDGLCGTAPYPDLSLVATDNLVVTGSWFNVSDDGMYKLANNTYAMTFGSDCTIGGTTPEARNIIAGGDLTAVIAYGHRNTIQGNYFGIAPDGATPLDGMNMLYLPDPTGNSLLYNQIPPHDNVIGGTVYGARNLFVGSQYVLWLDMKTSSNLVQGNYFATDKDAATAIGSYVSIHLAGKGNTVGGTTNAARNVIAGSSGSHSIQTGIQINWPPDETASLIVQGNYIGTDATGTKALGKLDNGIELTRGAKNITVGGAVAGAGNVIASADDGIRLDESQTLFPSDITIQGNFIGTDKTGMISLPNSTGISVLASSGNRIGGTIPGARNIISGNSSSGVALTGYTINGQPGPPSTNNVIEGNYIGVASDGVTPLGNSSGIWVGSYAANNTIGALNANASGAAGSSNTIAHNRWNGVSLSSEAGVGNRVIRNSIHSNAWLPIDLGFDSVTPNHATSPTAGPNLYQNAPVLADAETATGWSVKGTLHSIPNKTFQINFYSNCGLNPFGFAEGETWLRAINVDTSSMGDAIFNQTFPIMDCSLFTATATDPDGNTSEMSIMGTGQQIGPTGGTIEYTDGQGLKTTIAIPEGGVATPLTFVYTAIDEPRHDLPADIKSAGHSFVLAAYNRFIRMNGYEFLEPTIVTIKYSDKDVAGIDESKLKLYSWDGQQWVDAATTCTPASEYTRNVNTNTISVPVCQVGDYVLGGPPLDINIMPIIELLLLDD